MTLYTVLAPKLAPGAEPEPADFVFVKEGICWPALFFPGLWLVFRRMWLVLLLLFAFVAALVALALVIGGAVPAILLSLARALFALEANEFRRWTLHRKGYRLIGVAEGGRREEAELRFFLGWSPSSASPPPPVAPLWPWPIALSPESGGVVGLFPSPGGVS